MEKEDITKRQLSRKTLKLRKLNEERLRVIEKMKLDKDAISRWQLVKAVFSPKVEEHSKSR